MKTKWRRICSGHYEIGNIAVHERWHPRGTYDSRGNYAKSFMWHIIVDGKSVEGWAYLKDAKEVALNYFEKGSE